MASIRLVGSHHTSHHDGAVLEVTLSEARAASNVNLVTLRRARQLVAKGDAEWVTIPPTEPIPAVSAIVPDGNYVERQCDALGELLRATEDGTARYDVLYIAQQALSWALDPRTAASPLDVINKYFPEHEPPPPHAPAAVEPVHEEPEPSVSDGPGIEADASGRADASGEQFAPPTEAELLEATGSIEMPASHDDPAPTQDAPAQ